LKGKTVSPTGAEDGSGETKTPTKEERATSIAKEIFGEFDADKNGQLTWRELKTGIRNKIKS